MFRAPGVIEGSCGGGLLVNVREEVIGVKWYSGSCIAASIYMLVRPYLEWIEENK